MDFKDIESRLASQTGKVGLYVKNLVTGETYGFNQNEVFISASVIKLPVFMAICKWASEGKADFSEKIHVNNTDKRPLCGALSLFTDELDADIRTLCNLMISLSDNTATTLLIKRFSIPAFREEFKRMGLFGTVLNNVFFLREEVENTGIVAPEFLDKFLDFSCGIENKMVPVEIGNLLEQVYYGEFVSKEVSDDIVHTLLLQQNNHKIPGYIESPVRIAHKTGENSLVSHDVGIVYAKQPYVVCFAGNHVNIPKWETLIREISNEIFLNYNG